MKRLVALFDWDQTVRKSFAFTTWSNLLVEKGFISKKFLEENEVEINKHKNGIYNSDELVHNSMSLFCSYLKNVKVNDSFSFLDECKNIDEKLIFPIMKNHIFPFLREHNIEIIVISGSPFETIEVFKEAMGISEIFALSFDNDGSIFNGNITFNSGLSKSKEKVVNQICSFDKEVIFAFGDSLSDVPLLRSAKCSFVNNSKKFIDEENVHYFDFDDDENSKIIINKMQETLNNIN